MRRIAATLLFTLAATGAHAAQGVITRDSPHSVADTSERLVAALEQRGLTIFGQIDHAANAEKVGAKMPPTRLVMFGNPRVGTALMQCQVTMGLELPQKALIWEDAAGKVHLSYPDPEQIATRHGVGDCGEAVTKLQAALKDIAFAATTEEPSTLSATAPRQPDVRASKDDPAR